VSCWPALNPAPAPAHPCARVCRQGAGGRSGRPTSVGPADRQASPRCCGANQTPLTRSPSCSGSRAYERFTASQILKKARQQPALFAGTEQISLISSAMFVLEVAHRIVPFV
jgi:hypothetical protein